MERFINNKFLSSVLRPQPAKLCALVSIAEIIKIVKEQDVTFDEISTITGITKKLAIAGRVGNDKMIKMAQAYDIPLTSYETVQVLPDWESIKSMLKSEHRPIIYHSKGHYCLLVGFIEEPLLLNSGDHIKVDRSKTQKWLVIADHRVKYKTDHKSGMLEMVTWYTVRQTIKNNRNCALLVVVDKSET